MRKLIFILAFVLIGTFAFATDSNLSAENETNSVEIEKIDGNEIGNINNANFNEATKNKIINELDNKVDLDKIILEDEVNCEAIGQIVEGVAKLLGASDEDAEAIGEIVEGLCKVFFE